MSDNPGNPVAALRTDADRAREVVHTAAVEYARVRMMIAATLLRAALPGAARVMATIDQPHSSLSVYRVLGADGAEFPEELWVDNISLVEDELEMALHYFCDPETAPGWDHHDVNSYMWTLPNPGDDARSES